MRVIELGFGNGVRRLSDAAVETAQSVTDCAPEAAAL
jgi:hypothetical protein